MVIWCTTTLPLKVFTQRNLVADFIRLRLNFIQKNKKLLFQPPFGRLRAKVCTTHSIYSSLESKWSTSYSSWLNFFCYLLQLRCYKRKSVEVFVFQRGGSFDRKFQKEAGITLELLLVSENYSYCLLCGIKISAVHCLVLSQNTCVIDRQTGGHIYDS